MNHLSLERKKGKGKYIIGLFILWLIYAGFSLFSPVKEAASRYNISAAELNFLRVSFLIPYLFIWLAGLIAILHFNRYAALVAKSPEEKGFRKITKGLLMLFLVVVLPSFIGLVLAFYPDSAAAVKGVTIIRNLITAALYMAAFWYFFQASKDLNNTIGKGSAANKGLNAGVMGVIALLSLAYAWAIFHNQFRTVSSDPLVRPTYFLSDWLIVLSVIVPYIFTWVWGSLAVVNFKSLIENVQGVVYRKAFVSVAYGLSTIIILSIGVQFLSQASVYLGHATLAIILAIVYVLILLIAAGYLFIARGARKLAAIEEIQ